MLRSPSVQKVLLQGGTVEDLADALLAVRQENGQPPVGERWDGVEATMLSFGYRPTGHVGRAPLYPLEAYEHMLMRIAAAEELLSQADR